MRKFVGMFLGALSGLMATATPTGWVEPTNWRIGHPTPRSRSSGWGRKPRTSVKIRRRRG